MNKAIFWDRDGVIIQMYYDVENGVIDTVQTPIQVEFIPGIFKLLREIKKLGYLNILVSNQPGVGLKKINKKNFQIIKSFVQKCLKQQNIIFDKEYYCFHHPFAKISRYKLDCNCRKPKPGLLLQAAKELNINLKKSWMVGDGITDIIAGDKAGCKTILLGNIGEGEYLRLLEEKLKPLKPDYLVKKLNEILSIIQKNTDRLET